VRTYNNYCIVQHVSIGGSSDRDELPSEAPAGIVPHEAARYWCRHKNPIRVSVFSAGTQGRWVAEGGSSDIR
jgi:hypothetical protein